MVAGAHAPYFMEITLPPVVRNGGEEVDGQPVRHRLSSVTSPTEFPGLFDANEPPRRRSRSRANSNGIRADPDGLLLIEEGREYMRVCDHNLHSVLSNAPRTSLWNALSTSLQEKPDYTIPPAPVHLETMSSTANFKPYKVKYGAQLGEYVENHQRSIQEQLSSSLVPSMAVADEDVV